MAKILKLDLVARNIRTHDPVRDCFERRLDLRADRRELIVGERCERLKRRQFEPECLCERFQVATDARPIVGASSAVAVPIRTRRWFCLLVFGMAKSYCRFHRPALYANCGVPY